MIHPTAIIDPSATIGAGTVIWAYAFVGAGAVIGEQCRIGHGAYIDREVRVGDRVVIHGNASIYRPVVLGNDVFVGPHVVFANDPDPRAQATRDLTGVSWKVGDGATVGANATVLSDIDLAPHCLIGAGAVVSRPTVPFGIYAGVPARLTGYRCSCGAKYPGSVPPQECAQCHRRF
jgi:UDP-2-acetamido-3-amino-2,3-dideoxy-glucuronate N-acetyltransferase